MKAVNFSLLLAVACLAASVACAEPYKLGAILALSGPTASAGMACQNAMNLALKDMPPSTAAQLKIIFEDDAMEAVKTVPAYLKLKNADKIDAVLTFSSSCANAAAPLAEADKIPNIAVATDPKIVKGRTGVFTLWVTPESEAEVVVSEMKRRGYKRIAALTALQDGMIAIFDAISRENRGAVETVLHEEYPASTQDFRAFLSKLKTTKNVDAIFVGLMPGQNGLFAKQARQLGLTMPLFNVETFENPTDITLSEGALYDAWYVQADNPDEQFLNRFRAAYPDSSIHSAANCYDAVLLAASALEKHIPLLEYLSTVKDFKGALGTFSASSDQRFLLPATVKIITPNGFEKQRL